MSNMYGTRLRELRRDQVGWSLTRLAEESELDQSQLSKIELGKRIPQRHTVERLAFVLGDNVQEALRVAGYSTGDAAEPVNQLLEVIGNQIRKARESAGWTQEELAKEIGSTRTSVAHYEAGNVSIPAVNLFAIARACGVGIQYLYNDGPVGNNHHATQAMSGDILDLKVSISAVMEDIAQEIASLRKEVLQTRA